MELEKIVMPFIGVTKYFGRSALDAGVIYGLFKVQGLLDEEQIIEIVGIYTLSRYGVDMFDSFFLKQGRIYETVIQPLKRTDKTIPLKE